MRHLMPRLRGVFSLVFFKSQAMNNIKHSALEFVGEVATAYPRTWIYSFFAAGMVFAVALYGAFGYWVGGFFGHPQAGMYLSLTWYGYWFATNVEELKLFADIQVAKLETLAALLK